MSPVEVKEAYEKKLFVYAWETPYSATPTIISSYIFSEEPNCSVFLQGLEVPVHTNQINLTDTTKKIMFDYDDVTITITEFGIRYFFKRRKKSVDVGYIWMQNKWDKKTITFFLRSKKNSEIAINAPLHKPELKLFEMIFNMITQTHFKKQTQNIINFKTQI